MVDPGNIPVFVFCSRNRNMPVGYQVFIESSYGEVGKKNKSMGWLFL
jgi:hypothetical protein